MKRKVERSDDFVQASVVTHRHFDRCVFNSSNSHRYANIVVRVDFGPYLFPFVLILVGALLILAGLDILL